MLTALGDNRKLFNSAEEIINVAVIAQLSNEADRSLRQTGVVNMPHLFDRRSCNGLRIRLTTVLSGTTRQSKISSILGPGSGIRIDKDHLPLLEDQNPL